MLTLNHVAPLAIVGALAGFGDPYGHGVLERTVLVMDELAVKLQDRRRAPDAERLYRADLALCAPGKDVPACRGHARVLNNLGSLYYQVGRYDDAGKVLERAVILFRAQDAALELGSALGNLAAVERARAHYREASDLYHEALAIRESVLGPNDLRTVALLNNMAMLAQDLGEYARGERLARRALQALLARETPPGATLALAQTTLASILRCEGRLDEALELFRTALDTRARLLGRDHWLVADTLTGIAFVERLQGRLADAESTYRRALDIFRRSAKERQLIATLNNLAQVLAASEKWREAGALYREAAARATAALGAGHPETGTVLSNLATFLHARREYKEAEAAINRALDIDRASFPPDHPQIGFDLGRAGVVAAALGRHDDAERLLRQSIAILERRLGPGHAEVGIMASALADVYVKVRNLPDAQRYYAIAARNLSAGWGADDRRLLPTLQRYSAVLRARSEFAEAQKVELQVTRIELGVRRSAAAGIGSN
jgi:tetratricopeptide (TPR) repeat protein